MRPIAWPTTGTPVMDALGRFFGWLSGQVADMPFAMAIRKRLSARRRHMFVLVDGEAADIVTEKDGRATPLGRLPMPDEKGTVPDPEYRAVLRRIRRHRGPVVLRLPRSYGMVRPVTVPRTQERTLRQILHFQIDRLTPWTADQVLFAHEVTGVDEGENSMRLTLFAVPRATVAALGDRLRPLGITPTIVDLATDDISATPRINMLADGDAPPRHGKARRVLAWLAVGLVSGYFAIGMAAIFHHRAELDQARRDLDAARLDAEVAGRLRDAMEALSERAAFVDRIKRETPSPTILIEVLSRLLPDDNWLTALSSTGTRIDLFGFSKDASSLLTAMERSRHFQEVQFRSPLVREVDVERFHITAEIIPSRRLDP